MRVDQMQYVLYAEKYGNGIEDLLPSLENFCIEGFFGLQMHPEKTHLRRHML